MPPDSMSVLTKEKGGAAHLAKVKKQKYLLGKVINMTAVALAIVMVIYFFKVQQDISDMEVQLMEKELQVYQMELINQEWDFLLRDQEYCYERILREKLDFAHPKEGVFEDASGA